jgi:hypothetical protein
MHKTLIEALKKRGLLKYGAVFSGDLLRELIGVQLPTLDDLVGLDAHGIRRAYDNIKLTELGAVDTLRTHLLDEGKYLQQANGDFRILLPNENVRQAELYMQSGDRKLSRAAKLLRNTPKLVDEDADQLQARIMMKREGLSERRRRDNHAP